MTKYLQRIINLRKSGELNVEAFDSVYEQASQEDKKKQPFASLLMGCNQRCSECVFYSLDEMKRSPCIVGELAFSLKEMKAYDDEGQAFRCLKLIQFQAALEIYESNNSFRR